MGQHNETGKIGEKIAIEYLVKKKYEIIETNWVFKHKEIDIIAKKDDKIIFVEVKTRTSTTFELPKEAVTKKKQKNLIYAADAYLQQHNVLQESQFDIISVLAKEPPEIINHIEKAFLPAELF